MRKLSSISDYFLVCSADSDIQVKAVADEVQKKLAKEGIKCLKNYRKEFDEKNNRFKDSPLHDWASHGADAFRYAMVSLDNMSNESWHNQEIQYSNLGII